MLNSTTKGPILVVAPHPDDETLGAGGLLLRAAQSGHPIHWLIATQMRAENGWNAEKMNRRTDEIDAVANAFGFASVHILPFPTTRLDTIPDGDLIAAIGDIIKIVNPETLLLPHRGDAHSDHAAVHDAAAACAKWFRYPSVKWTLVYETLSETDASIKDSTNFNPDVFVDISDHIDEKLRIMDFFEGEIHPFPFPRSHRAVRALADLRGAAMGAGAAEAFMLLRANM